MPSYAESSISSICDYIEQLNIKNYYTKAQAPTVVSDAGTESVSGYNGELGFSKTDFSLEQKGDLTLDFTRVYNSNGYFLKNDEEDQTNEDKILSLTFDEEISIYNRILVGILRTRM